MTLATEIADAGQFSNHHLIEVYRSVQTIVNRFGWVGDDSFLALRAVRLTRVL